MRSLKQAVTALVALATGALWGQLAVTPQTPDKGWTHGYWLPRFDATRAAAKTGEHAVVFLGDSITEQWEKSGKDVWAKRFAEGPYKALNCGFSGDRTEHLLWRLDHGQLDGAKPKVFVVMIGSNNTDHRDAEHEPATDTILGIQSVLARLAAKWPEAKTILHPIFPTGATTNDAQRVRNDRVNAVIRQLADGKQVIWCDFNAKLLTAEGELEKGMSPDLVHFAPAGYEIWAAALAPFLDYALGLTDKAPKAPCRAAPTTYVRNGPVTTFPAIKKYWLHNANPKVEPRIRNKRAEECANADRYYDAIWIGDSITHFWEHKGRREVFEAKFGGYKILNCGFGGDHTENTLWNIKYGGILDGVHTRLITLMIGTNNTWGDSAEDIAAGVKACLEAIRAKQPQSTVILYPLIPREVAHKRGERDYTRKNGEMVMPKQTRVNEIIKTYADGEKVIWCDLTPVFTDAEGLPDVTRLADGTHPNEAGYTAWADAVLPLYKKILGF